MPSSTTIIRSIVLFTIGIYGIVPRGSPNSTSFSTSFYTTTGRGSILGGLVNGVVLKDLSSKERISSLVGSGNSYFLRRRRLATFSLSSFFLR